MRSSLSLAPRALAVAVVAGALTAVGAAAQSSPRAGTTGSADTAGAGGNGPWPLDVETAPRPMGRAVRAAARPVIDGRLDEAAWADARVMGDFIQSQPRRGYPATEPTVVRVMFDDDHLYIGAFCYDSDPEHLTVTTLEYGFESRDSDVFGVTLDPFLDRRNSFMFLVNPMGAVRDGQTFNDSRGADLVWRGAIQLRTEVVDSGWTVEMAIPWTTLRFDPGRDPQDWGLNFLRRVRRKNEDSHWAPLDRRDPVHRMSKAGTLEGLEGLRSGRNLRVKPYVRGGLEAGSALPGAGTEGDAGAGIDVKYGITPGLTLDLTYATDFSQVEVDQLQVNLTRFPLFFPERRDFFVENSGSFTFGDVNERNYRMGASLRDFTLFHSRRIGLTSGGLPIPITGGARLTGRAGDFELGFLNMQTQRLDATPPENFSVARVRRNVLGTSDVGAMLVHRQATDGTGTFNRSLGADANVRLLRGLIVNSYVAATDATDAEGDRTAARVSAAWRDRLWDASVFLKRVGEGFDPGVGFVRRTAARQAFATVGAHPRPPVPHVQEVNPYLDVDYVTDLEGLLETRRLTGGLGVELLDGGTLTFQVNDRFERLYDPFRVAGATVPAGDYGFREAVARYSSDPSRSLSGGAAYTGGGYFGGSRRTVSADGSWRPSYRWWIDLGVERNHLELPDTTVSADLLSGRLKYAWSTRLFGSAFVQYDAAAEQLVTSARVNLIHAPLSDLFLVFTERRNLEVDAVEERAFVVKLTRMVQF